MRSVSLITGQLANTCLSSVFVLRVDYTFNAKLSISRLMLHMGTMSLLFFPRRISSS